MCEKRFLLLVIIALLAGAACSGQPEAKPTPTPEPPITSTVKPTPTIELTDTLAAAQAVALTGPACPDGFQEGDQRISKEIIIGASSFLTLTLGSTPSIPCGWQSPEIEDEDILRQVDHQSEWPAAGVTPMPGAPGKEIWTFQALKGGESAITLTCSCLGEEGGGQELAGTFVLEAKVK